MKYWESAEIRCALKIAKAAHMGQTDKCGMPYWLHPYRVGLAVSKYGADSMIAGFLHDVVEDTLLSFEQLTGIGGSGALRAVEALTRRDGESYSEYIKRVEQNEIAVRVKIADLTDNLRHDRVRNLWGPSKFAWKTKGMYEQYLKQLTEKYGKQEGE